MEVLNAIIGGLIWASVGITVVRQYLTVNKIWSRKHETPVAESVSVAACALGILTGLPFLIQQIANGEITYAINTGIGLTVGVIFFLIGIGVWVKDRKNLGFWKKVGRAFKQETNEAGDLVIAMVRPAAAKQLLQILHQVALIDDDLDENEAKIIRTFAKQWALEDPIENMAKGEKPEGQGLIQVRDSIAHYLTLDPPKDQATQLVDVLQMIVEADQKVTEEEQMILAEVEGLVANYVGDEGPADSYEVLIATQGPEQEDAVHSLFPNLTSSQRAGGKVYIVGCYFSAPFADMVCEKYRALNFFTVSEKVNNVKNAESS
jgi:uncharacterized tellurite resistance protein B-like protein